VAELHYIPVAYGDCDRPVAAERKQAVERAEMLLRQYLTNEQLEDWEAHGSIVVKGSLGHLFRLTPRYSGYHKSVVREDHLGIAVWPIGLDIPADWVLAMMLRLEAHEDKVVEAGCHGRVDFYRLP